MFPNNDRISTSQLINILILTMVGVGILTMPRILVEEAGTDGWMVLIAGGVFSIIFAFLHGYIIKNFPGKSWLQILSLHLPQPIAYLVGLYFIFHFIGIAGFVIRIFTDVVKNFMLPTTPKGVILLSLLLVVGYLGRKGIEVLGRLAEILVAPLGVVILALFALSWVNLDLTNLLPAFQTSFIEIIKGIPSVFFSFLGVEVILIFGMFLNQPEKSTKTAPIAIAIVLILYLILNASVLGNLGVHQIQYTVWPLLTIFESVELPGVFIENVGIFVMGVWIFAVFTTIAPMYLAATFIVSQLFDTKEYNYFVLPLLPFVYYIAYWSDSLADVYEDLETLRNYTGFGVMAILPLWVFLSMMMKRTKKNKEM